MDTVNPNNDGIDHINVYSRGKTELGRKLTNFAYTPFDHPEDGKFNSIEGYWYWLGCKDDKLRKAYGFGAKKLGRELGAPDWLGTEDFKRKVKLAIRAKLIQHPKLLELLVETDLPLLHYYVYGDVQLDKYKVVLVKQGQWILDEIQDIRDEQS